MGILCCRYLHGWLICRLCVSGQCGCPTSEWCVNIRRAFIISIVLERRRRSCLRAPIVVPGARRKSPPCVPEVVLYTPRAPAEHSDRCLRAHRKSPPSLPGVVPVRFRRPAVHSEGCPGARRKSPPSAPERSLYASGARLCIPSSIQCAQMPRR